MISRVLKRLLKILIKTLMLILLIASLIMLTSKASFTTLLTRQEVAWKLQERLGLSRKKKILLQEQKLKRLLMRRRVSKLLRLLVSKLEIRLRCKGGL